MNEIFSSPKAVYRAAKTTLAIEHDTKIFQIIWNFQKVVGFDISYANNAPPIGAPKAQLTPAEAPAAMKTLFC